MKSGIPNTVQVIERGRLWETSSSEGRIMPLVIGAAAIAFIFLALLTIITLYWVLTKWHDFAKGIPAVGGALASLGDYLRQRNLEILNAVIGVAHSLISWSIDRVHDGFKL